MTAGLQPRRGTAEGPSEAFTLHALAQQLAMTAHRFGLLALLALGRLLEVATQLHLAEDTLPLQLLLKGAQRLVDIVVANVNLHGGQNLLLMHAKGSPASWANPRFVG